MHTGAVAAAPLIRRHDALAWRRCLDGVVVSSPHGGDVLYLAPPGDAIWEALDSPTTVEVLADRLSARFGESSERVMAETQEFITLLRSHGVVIDA